MTAYGLELNDKVTFFTCLHCGEESDSVGMVSRTSWRWHTSQIS